METEFLKIFGPGDAPLVCFAPGRVNLIGEHTDYNGGYVFPCALSLGTWAALRPRGDALCKFVSANQPEVVETPLNTLRKEPAHGWANYPKAVADQLLRRGHKLGGFDLYVRGDLPNSAGLSSSASLELATAVGLNRLFRCGITQPLALAELCQAAENQFVGVNCGILDQFAVAMGKKDMAVLLHCGTMASEYVPLALGGARLLITNTNKPRGLADSAYNQRRAECETALAALQTRLNIKTLGEVSPADFEANADAIPDAVCRKRAEHVVREDARVLAAVESLRRGDLPAFGRLMNASHASLRDLYEVTGPELDALAEAAWKQPGVLGSRMTGAGFGGCTVSIVEQGAVEAFMENVGAEYTRRTGLAAAFYVAETGDGAAENK
jgi:galactokinase